MKITLPTAITLFRIALIPLFVLVFYLPFTWAHIAATAFFAFASLTDWVDGYLARSMQQESSFGAFLDPVADKLMVVVVIVLLVQKHPSIFVALPSVVIVAREISISALREWMAQIGSSATVKVSWIGKSKTMLQMVALGLMIFAEPLAGLPIFQIGLVTFYIAAILTLVSMVNYLRAAWPVIARHG
ncbi:MAG TPA: CDP-diacylglycerol--glycerol-3-phosphate 3-phosphatidyltransferase [Gammaproteobacteria bacterium]|nr:CDP-diacylglycerol--glycerol-3-phosphate 3-phosphatidyltransferase [Gammaproteobacteria bacterium]